MTNESLDPDRDEGEEHTEESAAATIPPEAVTTEDSSASGKRTSRFEVYRDRAGEWRWRLVHWNGNILADSGEGYASRSNAVRAVQGVKRAVPDAEIEHLD